MYYYYIMYSKITDPQTGKKISADSKLGKQILTNYLTILEGGGVRDWFLNLFKRGGERDDSDTDGDNDDEVYGVMIQDFRGEGDGEMSLKEGALVLYTPDENPDGWVNAKRVYKLKVLEKGFIPKAFIKDIFAPPPIAEEPSTVDLLDPPPIIGRTTSADSFFSPGDDDW